MFVVSEQRQTLERVLDSTDAGDKHNFFSRIRNFFQISFPTVGLLYFAIPCFGKAAKRFIFYPTSVYQPDIANTKLARLR